jgi:hypothetical protein
VDILRAQPQADLLSKAPGGCGQSKSFREISVRRIPSDPNWFLTEAAMAKSKMENKRQQESKVLVPTATPAIEFDFEKRSLSNPRE